MRSGSRLHEVRGGAVAVFERFNERARQVIVLAQDEARGLKHHYIGTEHLLLGLLREETGSAASVLRSLDITVGEVRQLVARIVGQGDEPTSGQIPFTPRAKRVIELALREALSLGHAYIGTEHILLGIVDDNEGVAARMLLDFDVDSPKLRREVARALNLDHLPPPPRVERREPSFLERVRGASSLGRYGTAYGHRRSWTAITVAVGSVVGALIWQWASVDVNDDLPNACDPAFHVDPAGGWIVPAAISLGPATAMLLTRGRSGTTSLAAIVVAVLSAVFSAFFWVQLIGLAECATGSP